MKYFFTITLLLFSLNFTKKQKESAFKEGEWFKFRMSYSGFLKAGEGTLHISEKTFNGKPVFHVVGKGKTTGVVNTFFRVRDHFESYFDKNTVTPYRFIRKTDEGGYTKDLEIDFDHNNKSAIVKDKKNNETKEYAIQYNVQDMLSAFYYLRNNYDTETIAIGDIVKLNMFFDDENYPFRLKYLGRETISTKLNGNRVKIETLRFRPYVMSGRVFKEEESLTVWVSADKNKIPVKIKADLRVGSLRADLESFNGLKHPFDVKID